jgi:ribonucleotide reductase beta subunit family protein with ferritin-like domain
MSNTTKRIWHDRSAEIVEAFPEYSDNFSDAQLKHIWLPKEIKVEKDKHNIMVDMSESERHGILSVLQLFTKYEVFAGEDWWGDRFKKIVKGPEFSRMASVFSAVELAVHKPFYQQLNQVFGLDTNEFYTQYVNDPVLSRRIDFIDSTINHHNDLVSLACFSFIEGAILYSAFAYLKSFQANGKSDIKTIVSGINYTLTEEGMHANAAATVFRHLVKETTEDQVFEERYGDPDVVRKNIEKAAQVCYEHEVEIVKKIFEKGTMNHITSEELIGFVGARMNACLQNLGYSSLFPETNDTVSDWFYKNTTSFVMHDFFNSQGSQYTATWLESDFDMSKITKLEN